MENKNLEVVLAKELCPICGKEMDGPIIMNSVLTPSAAKKVKNLHGKVIGFSENACKECSKYKDDVVYLIGIDSSLSDTKSLEGLYRTGDILGVKREDSFIVGIAPKYILKTKNGVSFMFLDKDIMDTILNRQ